MEWNIGKVVSGRLGLQAISKHLQISGGCEVVGVFQQPI
jgi:hypothetical protein